jgi:hypothetical protein
MFYSNLSHLFLIYKSYFNGYLLLSTFSYLDGKDEADSEEARSCAAS